MDEESHVCEHGEEWSCCSECGCYCEQRSLNLSVENETIDVLTASKITTATIGCRREITSSGMYDHHERGCIHEQGMRWFIA